MLHPAPFSPPPTWKGPDVENVIRAAEGFGLDVEKTTPAMFGGGLIHATWRLETAEGPHLVQRLNSRVFADPTAVAENAAAAAARLDDALHRRGDDDPRHRLVYLAGPQGQPWLRDSAGAIWRTAVLVPGARSPDPARPAEVRDAARVLGRFPGLVTEGRGPEPRDILPGFHDTPSRLAFMQTAADRDTEGRLAACHDEFARLRELAPLADRLPPDRLPLRFVHNDAKLDNVLVDARTGEALCVVDLDTVMPGLAPHDFGDLVRSAVTGRPEDEPDLDRVTIGEARFLDLAAGYLEGAADWIADDERAALVDGALVITYEQALRFLADHLAGDPYYLVDDPEHNLRRARAQLRLLSGMLAAEVDLRRHLRGI